MGVWIKHSEDTLIPTWLKMNLTDSCMHCGSPMLNYYNDDKRCTNRKCSNPKCYGFLAAKADVMRQIVGIEGIGYESCLKDAMMIKATSQFQLLKLWGSKPTVSLVEYLKMHCFEGIDTEWERIVIEGGYYSVEGLLEGYKGKWAGLLNTHKDELFDNLQYVTLKKPVVKTIDREPQILTIMITGTPIGYNNKDHFVDCMNAIGEGYIKVIHQKTKRKSNVDCLIREPGSTTRGKVEAAKAGGIPIITSAQFIDIMKTAVERIKSE